MPVKHVKTNTVPAWTQADLDAAIASGSVPAGTTLSGFVLSTDWNSNHVLDISDVLQAGTNISLTGSGTAVSPFVINASGGGAVSSVSNSDGTLTISTTTGAVVASLALGHANTWTAAQTHNAPIKLGSSGYFIANSNNGFVINNNADTLSFLQIYPSGGVAIGTSYANNGSDPGSNNFIVQGNIGVGTVSPGAVLQVDATQAQGNVATVIINQESTIGNTYGMAFKTASSSSRNWAFGFDVSANGDFSIMESAAAGGNPFSGTTRLYFNPSGLIGLGTTSPQAQFHVNSLLATRVGFIIEGASSQSADLQQWQDSSGTVLANISNAGLFTVSSLYTTGLGEIRGGFFEDQTNSVGYIDTATDATHAWTYVNRTSSKIGFSFQAAGGQTADITQWQDSSANILAKITSGGLISSNFAGSSSTTQAALGVSVVGATVGNFYALGVQKTGVQEFYFGINKNSTTNSIPASACFITTYTSSGKWTVGRGNGAGQPNTIDIGSTDGSGNIIIGSKITSYNGVAAVGSGVPAIYGTGRSTAQTAAVASVATYTVGAADGSFLVSSNVNVTAFAVGTFNVTVTYTDETNTSQTLKMNFSSLTGTIGIAIAATGPFEGIPAHIRCKAATAITVATSGTFTSLTYNVEGYITQIG